MSGILSWDGAAQSLDGEWVVTIANGAMTKIERLHATTQTRREMSADEYAWVQASHDAVSYLFYCAGMRDYANALASGNIEAAQAYYKGATEYLDALGQG